MIRLHRICVGFRVECCNSAHKQPKGGHLMTAIAFKCPACGRSLKAGASRAGKTLSCPRCSEPIRVPSAEETDTSEYSVSQPETPPLIDTYEPPAVSPIPHVVEKEKDSTPKRRIFKTGSKHGLPVVSSVLHIVALLIWVFAGFGALITAGLGVAAISTGSGGGFLAAIILLAQTLAQLAAGFVFGLIFFAFGSIVNLMIDMSLSMTKTAELLASIEASTSSES